MHTPGVFTASYPGGCGRCAAGIQPGDRISWTGPGKPYVHADGCRAEPLTGAKCPKCFLTMPLTGKCECDE